MTVKHAFRQTFPWIAGIVCAALAGPVAADRAEQSEPRPEVAPGIIPQIGVILRFPDELLLRDPEKPEPPSEPVVYDRKFPIGGQEAIERGFGLPLPWGLSVIGVHNQQNQTIESVSVALGRNVFPPSDRPLIDIPFVDALSASTTTSEQVKLDLWVLPFLNVFASVGRVRGDVDLTVNVNLEDIGEVCVENPIPLRPPICVGNNLSGTVVLPFVTRVNRQSFSFGTTGVYASGRWFGTATAAFTVTRGEKSSDIKSLTAGARFGRRFVFGGGHMFSPYFGVSYLDIETRVSGRTQMGNFFPNGDSINVNYEASIENTDKLSGVLGFNVNFRNGVALQAEWNKNGGSERVVATIQKRF